MDFSRKKLRLGDILIKEGVITEEQLYKGLELQKKFNKKLGETLVEQGIVTEISIAQALKKQLGMEFVELGTIRIPDNIVHLVDAPILRKYVIIPFEYSTKHANILRVAMADPMDIVAMDDVAIITNLQIEPVVATPSDIITTIDKYYGTKEALTVAEKYVKEKDIQENVDEINGYVDNVNDSPIVQLVKTMIELAVRQRASDIHIEALEKKIRIRYRIDGALYQRMVYDIRLLPAIVARIKIISGMDISEKRKPQDGHIPIMVDRSEYDIRVSILPTVFGEKVVMRIASKKALTRNKKELGFSGEELAKFEHILKNPNGIILVTGPTGSGKSTTLYTALSDLNREEVNIITVEDPIEANIEGINQTQVNPKANLTFATALRAILRQDPDIIMIGEIRDRETASIAVQASITGHLVVSTLHTNSAAGTITRLANMGIENYLIADATVGIIAQRLVRKLCPHCKQPVAASLKEKELLNVSADENVTIYEPCGCYKCDETGYSGRIGVYEIMEVTTNIKSVIANKGTMEEIKEIALKEGMSTLRMSASRLVLEGITSISEMIKVSFDT